jgi:cytochrome c oxidase assembly protein subunit 15
VKCAAESRRHGGKSLLLGLAASYVTPMPFDVLDYPAGTRLAARNRRFVGLWLLGMSAMIFVMVVLGGATRLTGSGLSIMEWAPLSGALPPLSDTAWQHLFDLYKPIPQYALLHPDMDLAGFKHIFWLEWVHRLWGRLIGLAFLLPLLWLWWRGAITRRLRARLVLLFALGGLQGAVGWFMVASGFFPDSTAVSPYRLVIHLALALVLYAALLWTGLSVLRPAPLAGPPPPRRLLALCVALVSLTILAGGFVAGTHAGLIDNTFPLMGGRLVPEDYAALHPFVRNLTENLAAVQFDHRLLATLTGLVVLGTVAVGLARRPPPPLRAALLALGFMVLVQYGLGVSTLLHVVPPLLATAHQAAAVLLLTAAIAALHTARQTRTI